MTPRICIPLLWILGCVLLGACQDEMESRSFISKFRLLGIQATPPEATSGDRVEVRGIFSPVSGKAANVAWITFDTQWLESLSAILPADIGQYSNKELQTLMTTLMPPGDTETPGSSSVLQPEYKVIVTPINPQTGIAVLPEENIVISPALIAMMRLLEQTSGFPLYVLGCSNGVLDETTLLQMVSSLTDTQQLGFLEDTCKGDDVEAIAAHKTINLYIPNGDPYDAQSPQNQNPVIDTFQIDQITHTANTPPAATGTVMCESEDGCRDPVEFRVSLTKDSFQYYQGYTRRQNELEKIFVSWFSNGGEFDNARIRSNDAQFAVNAMEAGNETELNAHLADPQQEHWFIVKWMPPVKGGTFDLWIVANDLRGGIGYARYQIYADAPNY